MSEESKHLDPSKPKQNSEQDKETNQTTKRFIVENPAEDDVPNPHDPNPDTGEDG